MIQSYNDYVEFTKRQTHIVPQISANTNFWMIRSKKGVFYNEFIREKFIAIGWNALTKSVLADNNEGRLKKYITEQGYQDKVPKTAINKCQRFVNELKNGDIAMIVGRDEITFAIIGDYFEVCDKYTTVEKELNVTAQIDSHTYLGGYCPYMKRRHISILTKININTASPAIYKCLVSNRHSLSNLNDYAFSIISCCYDIAYYSDRLILKYHVNQPKDINPIDFSLFTYNVAKLLSDEDSSISGKYNINSAGDIVLFITNHSKDILTFIQDNIVTVGIIYLILFGGKGFGVEIPSAVDKIKGWVSEIYYHKEIKRLKKVEVEKAEAEVEKIKSETNLNNAEAELKRHELSIKSKTDQEAAAIVKQLSEVAVPLDINQPSNEIMNFITVVLNNSES